MAKASRKRRKKKSAPRKSSAKGSSRKNRKVAAKRKRPAGKVTRAKSVKRKADKRKVAKRKAAKRGPAARKAGQPIPASKQDAPWPMLFAAVVAFLIAAAAVWHFTDFSMAANAATLLGLAPMPDTSMPVGAAYVGCEIVQAADTWLALMHPDLAPGAI